MIWCCAISSVSNSVHETDASEVVLRSSPQRGSRRHGPSGGFSEGEARERSPAASDPSSEEEIPAEAVPAAGPQEIRDTVQSEREVEQEEKEEGAEDGQFDVILEMTPGERLGALLDVLDMKTLRVAEVRQEGRLRLYNASVPDHKKVLPGYYIVGVNGRSGQVEEMVKELRRSRTWRLRVARKQEFTVTMAKSGPLCLDLQFEPESDCIVIRRIGEGLVRDYNQRAADDEPQIKVGDRILSVNDAQAPARTLLESIRANRELTMKIGRPRP